MYFRVFSSVLKSPTCIWLCDLLIHICFEQQLIWDADLWRCSVVISSHGRGCDVFDPIHPPHHPPPAPSPFVTGLLSGEASSILCVSQGLDCGGSGWIWQDLVGSRWLLPSRSYPISGHKLFFIILVCLQRSLGMCGKVGYDLWGSLSFCAFGSSLRFSDMCGFLSW